VEKLLGGALGILIHKPHSTGETPSS